VETSRRMWLKGVMLANMDEAKKGHGKMEEEIVEECLGAGDEEDASDFVEEAGVTREGSACENELALGTIGCSIPRTALSQATAEDESLQIVRRLGYVYPLHTDPSAYNSRIPNLDTKGAIKW